MSCASSGPTPIGVQDCHSTGQPSGFTYSARIVVVFVDTVSWRTPAGIQSARVGGSTHASVSERTVSTPLGAQASWWSRWVCQSNTCPGGIGNVTTTTAAPDSSVSSRHCPSCDIDCQATDLVSVQSDRTVNVVNEHHAKLCTSAEWATYLSDEVLLPLTQRADLGVDMLEIGPAPGAARSSAARRLRLTRLPVSAWRPGARIPTSRWCRVTRQACRSQTTRLTRSAASRCCTTCQRSPCRTGSSLKRSGSCGPEACWLDRTASRASTCTTSTWVTPTARSSLRR